MRTRLLLLAGTAALFAAMAACGPDDPGATPDAGTLLDDAGGGDADAGTPDAAPWVDAGPPEAPEDCDPYQPEGVLDDYTSIEERRNDGLRNALYALVNNHSRVSYDSAKAKMFGPGGFDVRNGKIECVYTGELFTYSQLDRNEGFNVEHSWPKSDGAESQPANSDMHHLFPTERTTNSWRSSHPFGHTDCNYSYCRMRRGGSELGPRIGTGETVFEVREPYRGDIARAHFYFAVRYKMPIPENEEETLRKWNRCDPPDDIERARNDAIAAIQKKRNPFVDRPEFVDYIENF